MRSEQTKRSSGIVRVRTWLHRHKLDRRLASGADPNLDPMSRQRALELLDPEARRRLAIALEELASPGGSRLDALVERLKAPAPVRAQGVARALLLITEGTGPLWGGGSRAELSAAAENALHELDHGPSLETVGVPWLDEIFMDGQRTPTRA